MCNETKLINRTGGTKLKDYKGELGIENFDLIAKVVYLLTAHELWSENGTFTFPDGETWARLEDVENEDD